jgi:hypothetical protein
MMIDTLNYSAPVLTAHGTVLTRTTGVGQSSLEGGNVGGGIDATQAPQSASESTAHNGKDTASET